MTHDRWLERVVTTLKDSDQTAPDLSQRIIARVRIEPARAEGSSRWVWVASGLAAALVLFALVRPRGGPQVEAVRSEPGQKPVAFEIDVSAASRVSLVGDFNNWDRAGTPMTRDRSGQWRATVSLPNGIYRYSFLVDDARWVPDPHQVTPVDNDFGEPTSLVTVE